MKIPFVSSFFPFLSGDDANNQMMADNLGSLLFKNTDHAAKTGSWLYTWQRHSRHNTRFFPIIGHVPYVDTLGHPWCFEGFGDALTMAMTQLGKSEMSMILSNAAAELDQGRSELLWDNERQQYVVANQSGVIDPGKPEYTQRPKNLTLPDHLPQNNIMVPMFMGVISKFLDSSSMGSKLRSMTDLLCQLSDAEAEAHPWSDNVYFCFVEDLVTAILVCGESEQEANCKSTMEEYVHSKEDFPETACKLHPNSLYYGVSPNEFRFNDAHLSLPILLIDLLKSTKDALLPRYIPEAVIMKEAMTYLLLFRANIIAASFSRRPYLCGADKINPPVLLPGWDLPIVLTQKQEGDPLFNEPGLVRDAIPLVFVSQSITAPCSFVVAVRGTASMFEWEQDFDYWQTPFPINPNVLTHVGFTRIVSVVAPILETFVQGESYKQRCSCSETHLIFTGHSLGAGVAQLLALYFAEKYGIERCGADISGAFFAPPRMFNEYGSERFRRYVNGRTLLDAGDGLSYLPCYDGNSKHGWPRCARGHMTSPGVGRDYYADNYGIAEIAVDYVAASGGKIVDAVMQTVFPSGQKDRPSLLASVFSKLLTTAIPPLNTIPALGVLGATHVCAFACKFSQVACGEDFKWWCNNCPMLI